MAFKVPEADRMPAVSSARDGNNGWFSVMSPEPGWVLFVIASDGEGWEHVSAHARRRDKRRTPTWKEMAFLKRTFWGAEDTVVQFHPPESEYVNNCPDCLHLWRPTTGDVLLPPRELVGIR